MSIRNDLRPRDASVCRDLASWLEEQAHLLRLHADDLDASALHDWRRTFQVWRSGKFARALIHNGMPEPAAISTTAMRLKVEEKTVAAQLRFQMQAAKKRARSRQQKEAP